MQGYTDLFLYDLKHMDSRCHEAVVKVPNELILENARKIAENHGRFQIRIPLIPGFNMCDENMNATGRFVRELGESVEVVQLLPYHKLGLVKWNRLHRAPPAFDAEPPADEEVEHCKNIIESYGLTVSIH